MATKKLQPCVLICLLLSGGCATSGGQVSVTCPTISPLTAQEKAKPTFRQQVLNELIEPLPQAKPR